jgi:hypothetical protein
MSFFSWWSEKYARPPTLEEVELFHACLEAYEAGRSVTVSELEDSDSIRVHIGPSKRAIVEFPFSETSPTLTGQDGGAYDQCGKIIEGLSEHRRNVLLLNLCSRFGKS